MTEHHTLDCRGCGGSIVLVESTRLRRFPVESDPEGKFVLYPAQDLPPMAFRVSEFDVASGAERFGFHRCGGRDG